MNSFDLISMFMNIQSYINILHHFPRIMNDTIQNNGTGQKIAALVCISPLDKTILYWSILR